MINVQAVMLASFVRCRLGRRAVTLPIFAAIGFVAPAQLAAQRDSAARIDVEAFVDLYYAHAMRFGERRG